MIDRPFLDSPSRAEGSWVDVEDASDGGVLVKRRRRNDVRHFRKVLQRGFLDPAAAWTRDNACTGNKDVLVGFDVEAGRNEPERQGGLAGILQAGQQQAASTAAQASRVNERRFRSIIDRTREQVDVQELEDGWRTKGFLDEDPVLDNPEVVPERLNRNDEVARSRPNDVRGTFEEAERFEDARVGRPQSDPTVERARDYFELNWINPSLISESMHALISA